MPPGRQVAHKSFHKMSRIQRAAGKWRVLPPHGDQRLLTQIGRREEMTFKRRPGDTGLERAPGVGTSRRRQGRSAGGSGRFTELWSL